MILFVDFNFLILVLLYSLANLKVVHTIDNCEKYNMNYIKFQNEFASK